MTVHELETMLSEFPPDAEVWVATECHGCFEPATEVKRDERGMVVIGTTD